MRSVRAHRLVSDWRGACNGDGMRLNFKRLGLLCGHAARACGRLAQLTSARADLLIVLIGAERSQVEIAALLCVTAPVVSRMLKALEEMKLVRRRMSPRDRRRKLVSLTDQGRTRITPCVDDYMGDELLDTWSAQCMGERVWTDDWKNHFARMGLRLETFRDLGKVAHGFFWAAQKWNRTLTYDRWFDLATPLPEPELDYGRTSEATITLPTT